MKRSIFRRITAMVLALIMVLSLCVFTSADDAEADDKFDDGAFKVLFIGNSASDDATDSGYQKDSKLYEIMKSMVGDTCRIEIGLCWSGGKTMMCNEGLGYHPSSSCRSLLHEHHRIESGRILFQSPFHGQKCQA